MENAIPPLVGFYDSGKTPENFVWVVHYALESDLPAMTNRDHEFPNKTAAMNAASNLALSPELTFVSVARRYA